MNVMCEKGSEARMGYTDPHLAHWESLLQELTRIQDHKRQQSVESASTNTKQKLLTDQLRQAQDELTAAQMSKTSLYEEIGALKQVKEHQTKQLNKYKMALQAAQESQVTTAKKMKELETSTWTIKQQYIQSLASRIKTSALVLQQLDVPNRASFNARVAEKCNAWEQTKPSKRKRIMEDDTKQRAIQDGNKSKPTEIVVDVERQSSDKLHSESASVVDSVVESKGKNRIALFSPTRRKVKQPEQQDDDCAANKRLITELQAQVAELESEHSALNDKYTALVCEHNEALADSKALAQEIETKNSKIEELMQMVEASRSKNGVPTDKNDEDRETLEGRLKMLEENLAQMNGYADQLEMVIAQCPSCTVKLQNESTQDSNRTE